MQVGEGEFGTVHKATWHRTLVAVKVLRASDEVALGDFRCAGGMQGFQGVGFGER